MVLGLGVGCRVQGVDLGCMMFRVWGSGSKIIHRVGSGCVNGPVCFR